MHRAGQCVAVRSTLDTSHTGVISAFSMSQQPQNGHEAVCCSRLSVPTHPDRSATSSVNFVARFDLLVQNQPYRQLTG